jgi:small subunit ribosomal protein S1
VTAKYSSATVRSAIRAQFARDVHVGQTLHGQITKLVPFGAFARVADGIEGLIHLSELCATPIQTPDQAVQIGDEVTAVVTDIDLPRRRIVLSRRRSGPH